jgi:hypothetical protein
VEQSPAGKNVSTEAENIGSDPSPGNDWWRHGRLRRLYECCGYSESIMLICSYVL